MTKFNNDEWCAKVRQAKDAKELGNLIMELPCPPIDGLYEILAKMDAAETPEALDQILLSIPKGGPNGLQLSKPEWLERVKNARTDAEKFWLYGDYPSIFKRQNAD